MICYLVTHNSSGKKYVGISNRSLEARRAEHESNSVSREKTFSSVLQKYGKENFTWKVLAEGDEEVIKMLERMLIGKWDTYHPKGFNLMNAPYDFELADMEEDQLRFAQEIDTRVAEIEMVYSLQRILNNVMNNSGLSQETKELIKPLIAKLNDRDCLDPA